MTEPHVMNIATAVNATRVALPYRRVANESRVINAGANAALRVATGTGPYYGAFKAGVHKARTGALIPVIGHV